MSPDRVDYLAQVMTELNGSLEDVTLMVIGGLEFSHLDYRSSLLEKLNSKGVRNVQFLGFHSDLRSILRRTRIFAAFESKPACAEDILQAMVSGVPVVAESGSVAAGRVRHGTNGFLVRQAKPREMARHLHYLLTTPSATKRFGKAALKTAKENFSTAVMARRYLKVLGSRIP